MGWGYATRSRQAGVAPKIWAKIKKGGGQIGKRKKGED